MRMYQGIIKEWLHTLAALIAKTFLFVCAMSCKEGKTEGQCLAPNSHLFLPLSQLRAWSPTCRNCVYDKIRALKPPDLLPLVSPFPSLMTSNDAALSDVVPLWHCKKKKKKCSPNQVFEGKRYSKTCVFFLIGCAHRARKRKDLRSF